MNTKTRLQFKRKRTGKTNYKKRLNLLKSRTTRLVVRRSNRYLSVQFVNYEPDGDKIIVGTTSKALVKLGWKNSCKSLPAAYLTGLLVGKLALDKKVKSAILDLGLMTPKKGGRLYAVVKGVIEAGVEVPSSEDIFPTEERLSGSHISDDLEKDIESIKSKI